MINRDLNTPIWQLTIGEFMSLIETSNEIQTSTIDFTGDQYVYGINGIAKLLNCSRVTAQKIKNSGQIDSALHQTGRTIVVDARLALELINQKSK